MVNIRASLQEVKIITWDITLWINDRTLKLDSSWGIFTVTLPAATTWFYEFTFKFIDVTNTITFATTWWDTIDKIIPALGASYTIQSDWISHWMVTNSPVLGDSALSSATITTGSTTYVLATGMTITPWAGNYLAIFSSSISNTDWWTTGSISIYKNWVIVPESVRTRSNPAFFWATKIDPISTNTLILWLLDWETIDVRRKTSAWTASLYERELNLIRIN